MPQLAACGGKQVSLFLIHAGVLVWRITKPPIEQRHPKQADQTEHAKGHAPGHVVEKQHHYQGREGAAPSRAEPHDSLGPDAVAGGQPIGEHPRDAGKAPGLKRAEAPSHEYQRQQIPCPSRRRREERPGTDDHRQHSPRAPAIAGKPPGNLANGIHPSKCGEDQAHLEFGQSQVFLDRRSRLCNHVTLQVRNDGQRDGEKDHHVTGSRGFAVGVYHESRMTFVAQYWPPLTQY